MDLSAKVLREVEFRDRLRGYDTDEVDEFLEKVAVAVEELQEKMRQLAYRAERAERSVSDRAADDDDDTIRRTLVLAQRTADLAVREAQEQAASLMDGARDESEKVLSSARRESEKLLSSARENAARLTTEAERRHADDIARLERRARQRPRGAERAVRAPRLRAQTTGRLASRRPPFCREDPAGAERDGRAAFGDTGSGLLQRGR